MFHLIFIDFAIFRAPPILNKIPKIEYWACMTRVLSNIALNWEKQTHKHYPLNPAPFLSEFANWTPVLDKLNKIEISIYMPPILLNMQIKWPDSLEKHNALDISLHHRFRYFARTTYFEQNS